MTQQYNQRCSTRKEDWQRFWLAILNVLHTGKNILVEEKRRLFKECDK